MTQDSFTTIVRKALPASFPFRKKTIVALVLYTCLRFDDAQPDRLIRSRSQCGTVRPEVTLFRLDVIEERDE